MQEKRVDIFGSFLTGSSADRDMVDAAAAGMESGDATLESALLHRIAQASAPIDVRTLIADTSGSPTQILKTLHDMKSVGLIESPAGETYRITDLGRDVSSAA